MQNTKTGEIDYWRQLDILSPDEIAKFKPILIGVGGLGSPVVMALAKMGVKQFTIYDDDVVDDHNIPNQMYGINDIGEPKVEAIASVAENFGAESIEKLQERYTDQLLTGPVICSVDTMAARYEIWEGVKYNPSCTLYIDMRMSAESGHIFCIDPNRPEDIEMYESNLRSDEESEELPCTARSIIYNTFLMASLVGRLVKGFVSDGGVFKRQIIVDAVNMKLYPLD